MTQPDPTPAAPTTGQPATTPTGKWLQDQLHDDATAVYAMTSGRFSIGNLVVKVQDAIPKIEAEARDTARREAGPSAPWFRKAFAAAPDAPATPLPGRSCRHGINPDQCEFCDGPGADKEEATRQAIRSAAPPQDVRAVIESFRYSEPLVKGTPPHDMWKRNEETLNAILSRLPSEEERYPRLSRLIRAALTDEDEIAHGEAWDDVRKKGRGFCAYCDDEWPCRTQRGIDRLLSRLPSEEER